MSMHTHEELAEAMSFTVVDNDRLSPGGAMRAHWEADSMAVELGIASELWECPNGHGLQGIEQVKHIKGTHRDFNASTIIQLRCRCWLL